MAFQFGKTNRLLGNFFNRRMIIKIQIKTLFMKPKYKKKLKLTLYKRILYYLKCQIKKKYFKNDIYFILQKILFIQPELGVFNLD